MNPSVINFLSQLKQKKLIIGVIFALILFLLLWLFKKKLSNTQVLQVSPAPTSFTSSPSQGKTPLPLPTVTFGSYDNKSPLPTVPNQVNGYTLKANYSVEEAKELGKKLGMTETKVPDERFVILYNMQDMNSRGILTFDRVTGGISFQSYGVIKPTTDNLQPTTVAQQFLTDLSLSDPTISCPITYEKKGLTGITYVECHRDWSLVGLPILNTIGVLNIPENKSLSSLAIGQTDTYSPDDPSITSVSFSPSSLPREALAKWGPPSTKDGKARPNDFNTITVGVTDDGRILSLESNMRKIAETKQYTKDDLLTPEEALNQFIQHKSTFSLTIPAGSGSVDWSKVYPDNKASGKKAIITDYLLTYLENPGQAPQDKLTPMYLIRGTAELSSGYTVRFMETVPALKSSLSFIGGTPTSDGGKLERSVSSDSSEVNRGGIVAGESTTYLAQNDSSLKLGTFQPTETISPQVSTSITVYPTGSSSTQTPTTPSTFQCTLPPGGKETILNIPGAGQLTVVYGTGHLGTAGTHAFFFKSASFPVSSIQEVRTVFLKLVEEQFVINVSKCLVENPLLMQATMVSVDDVYRLFSTLQASCTRARTIPLPAGQRAEGDPISTQIHAGVSEKVARRILELASNNQISAWANRPDVFPQEVTIFDFISVVSFSEGYAHTASCYISGISPMIYLYPEKEMEVRVNLGGPISYSYPSLSNNTWSVVAKPDGTFVESGIWNLESWRRLYYEYDKSKVSFTQSKDGFVVKTDEWERFIRDTLSLQLGLTKRETDDLVVDIRNALSPSSPPAGGSADGESRSTRGYSTSSNSNFPYLKLSFVSRKELEEKLSVTISPQPDTFNRIHLLLTSLTDNQPISNPSLQTLSRDGFTAVELGVSSSE